MSSSKRPLTEFDRFVTDRQRCRQLGQQGLVLWLYGLSGCGKSTLANMLERQLMQEGYISYILDGDNLRCGLNNNLGFSAEDRHENIRRSAEVAKLLSGMGIITIASFITPFASLRGLAKNIIGSSMLEVFVDTDFAECQRRDVKGLYAKAGAGEVAQFTGKDSNFERPEHADLHLQTGGMTPQQSFEQLLAFVRPYLVRLQQQD